MYKEGDLLLINPYDENAVKNALGFITPPLNLMYLAASLEKASFSVNILDDDLLQRGYQKITDMAQKINPQVVAVTATTSTIKSALKYVDLIKTILPNSLTVIGGPHTTFMPFETLKECENLDVVVMGEGEETIVDIANHVTNNQGLDDVKGIVYRDPNNGNVKANQPRPLIKDLDSIPFPARHLVPFESYGASKDQTGGIITSRGCVYNCNYCSSSLIMGKKFRSRSPNNVVDEIETIIDNYGIHSIGFMDDTFMINKHRAQEIADEIKARDLDLSFVASSRVDMVDQNLLKNLKDSGMKTLYYGVESGSQQILNLMKKGITLKQVEYAVKSAKNVGLEVLTSFILGYPGETEDDMNKTIDFSIKLDADYSQFSILTPFPGTPIYDELSQKELIDNDDWNKYTVLKPVLKYDKMGLNKSMVEKKLAMAYVKFYSRPRYLLKHRNMFKVITKTLLRSFVVPKLMGKTGDGWYQNFDQGK